jgi:hypothetical protein
LVELKALFELPGYEGDAIQVGIGKTPGEAAQCGSEAASHIEDSRRGLSGEMESMLYFLVHLLKHGFAPERIHAPAEEAEVHVKVRTPCGVVRTGFFVVALEVHQSGSSCALWYLKCGH